jgi:hypothetical protein
MYQNEIGGIFISLRVLVAPCEDIGYYRDTNNDIDIMVDTAK